MNLASETICSRKLTFDEQKIWVEEVRNIIKQAPLVRPETSSGRPMRVRISGAGKFGWVGARGGYRYDQAQAGGKEWPPIPKRWLNLADEVAGVHSWDSAIINWYDSSASLGWHRDKDENDLTHPIVTISLGDACSWAIQDDSGKAHRTRLESGDITLLAGKNRNKYHTVERIIESGLFSPLKTRGRISITIRVAG